MGDDRDRGLPKWQREIDDAVRAYRAYPPFDQVKPVTDDLVQAEADFRLEPRWVVVHHHPNDVGRSMTQYDAARVAIDAGGRLVVVKTDAENNVVETHVYNAGSWHEYNVAPAEGKRR